MYTIILFQNSLNLETINSNKTEIIVQQNMLFYVTNEENDDKIYMHDLDNSENYKSVSISNITKNKVLLSLNEESFILFGYEYENTSSNLFFKIYDSNQFPNIIKEDYFENITFNSKINIKMVNESIFLLYFFVSNEIIIYKLNLETRIFYLTKKIISITIGLNLNTIECDSFDGENILCVYSLISSTNEIKFYYFLEQFEGPQNHPNDVNNNYNIKAVSINN